jgi:excisionase family DNA binding protein
MSTASLPPRTEQIGHATVDEAAAYFRVARETVYGMIRRGELASFKVGKLRRIRWSELHRIAGEPHVTGESA